MDWLNIHRSTLAAEQFLGCEPIQRATWLCLMAYCADQENGGRIEGASEWGDRKWQQVVRITRDEAHDTCPLWQWIDGVLVVWSYPAEKEAEVRRNRVNGKTGGRPPKPKENQVVTSGLTQTEPSAPISAETERNRKGIGKEGEEERKVVRSHFVPPTMEDLSAYAKEVGLSEPQRWMDHYVSNGWKVGKSKMVDWKACVRNWARSSNQPKPQAQKPEWVIKRIEELRAKLATAERQYRRDSNERGADSQTAKLSKIEMDRIKKEIDAL